MALAGKRVVTFDPEKFPHLDHGYAVTSYSAQGKTMDRVLVNAETTETDLLLNQRMAYVAISRARFDARVYTDSAVDLGGALNRPKDKEMALEALKESQTRIPALDKASSIARARPRELTGGDIDRAAQRTLNRVRIQRRRCGKANGRFREGETLRYFRDQR